MGRGVNEKMLAKFLKAPKEQIVTNEPTDRRKGRQTHNLLVERCVHESMKSSNFSRFPHNRFILPAKCFKKRPNSTLHIDRQSQTSPLRNDLKEVIKITLDVGGNPPIYAAKTISNDHYRFHLLFECYPFTIIFFSTFLIQYDSFEMQHKEPIYLRS